jgi:nucleoside-diphosphate-sugar epimerase
VVAAAIKRGHTVLGVVRSQKAESLLRGLGAECVLVPGLARAPLEIAFQGAPAVVHLAQIGAERGGATYDEVNVAGTEAVTAAARRAGVRRVVFLSGLGVSQYGIKPRCTNRYFLSKLAAEVCLFRSGLDVTVLRPSYVLGPGGELVPTVLSELERGEVEQIGDGSHRMQPIAVSDVAEAILEAATRPSAGPLVVDLVGPTPLSYAELLARVAGALGRLRPVPSYRVRSITAAEADRQARAGGYRGMWPDELDCLLCDEVAGDGPLEDLLGRPLTPLDQVIQDAVDAAVAAR